MKTKTVLRGLLFVGTAFVVVGFSAWALRSMRLDVVHAELLRLEGDMTPGDQASQRLRGAVSRLTSHYSDDKEALYDAFTSAKRQLIAIDVYQPSADIAQILCEIGPRSGPPTSVAVGLSEYVSLRRSGRSHEDACKVLRAASQSQSAADAAASEQH